MMADAEDNFTNSSDYSDYAGRYGRKDYPLVMLYLAVPLWLITSLATVISASIVLLAIKRSKRNTITLHFFFVANLMITDIGVAVIRNGMAMVNLVMTIADPTREGIDCRVVAVTTFPISANAMMLAALCFDRMYSIAAPHHYRRNMTKRKGYVLVLAIWLLSFSLSFVSFLDPKISSNKTKGAFCGATLYKHFGLVAIILPIALTAVFVVIQNFYLYCAVLKTVTRNSTSKTGDDTSNTRTARTWRMMKETKKASITLLILSGTSVFFGVLQPVITIIIQSQAEGSLFAVIWFSLTVPLTHNINILLHSVLYGFFLHSIRESLGFNICRCFQSQ